MARCTTQAERTIQRGGPRAARGRSRDMILLDKPDRLAARCCRVTSSEVKPVCGRDRVSSSGSQKAFRSTTLVCSEQPTWLIQNGSYARCPCPRRCQDQPGSTNRDRNRGGGRSV